MATTAEDALGLGFSVDGVAVESGPYRAVVHRLVGGVFTADAAAVRYLLPSSRLHPLRFVPGRTLVMVNCTDADWYLGSLPPVRCANLLIAAVATPGDRPGPWVTPILTDAAAIRHRAGLVVLASISTSRVLSEANRAVLGWPGLVADVRNDQKPGLERFVATDPDGELIVYAPHREAAVLDRVRAATADPHSGPGQPRRCPRPRVGAGSARPSGAALRIDPSSFDNPAPPVEGALPGGAWTPPPKLEESWRSRRPAG